MKTALKPDLKSKTFFSKSYPRLLEKELEEASLELNEENFDRYTY